MERLRHRARQHALIAELATATLGGEPTDRLLARACGELCRALGVPSAGLWALQEGRLVLRAGVGWKAGDIGRLVVAPGRGSHEGFALARGRPSVMLDARRELRFRVAAAWAERGIVAALAAPVAGADGPWGALGVYADRHRDFSVLDARLVEAVAGLLGTLLDRERAETRRLELEARLRRSERLETMGTLASGLAHDFGNLLAVVGAATTIALDEVGPEGPGRRELLDIREASRRASGLTRDLLLFGRTEPGAPRRVDPAAVLAGVEAMLHTALGRRHRLLVESVGAPEVRIDPARLEQVLVNMVINAREALPEGGGAVRIRVGAVAITEEEASADPERTAGPHAEVLVEDDGRGISPDVLERVFEPYFTTRGDDGGTGLGLASAYGIVREAGGAIEVDSRPGHGTRFRILLPAAPEQDGSEEE